MIKSNELRLGSIIDFDGMKSVVKEIDNQGVIVFIKETDETEWIDLFQFTPISLTEEILLSIEGVNKKIVDNKGLELTIYTINDIELLFTFGILRNIKFMNNKVIIYTAFRDFKLHDLQNLYFALTNKELEINL